MAARDRRAKKMDYGDTDFEFMHNPFEKRERYLERLRYDDIIKFKLSVTDSPISKHDEFGREYFSCDYRAVDKFLPIAISWFTGNVFFNRRNGWLWPRFEEREVCYELYDEYRRKNIYSITTMFLEMLNIRDSFVQYSLDHHLESQYNQCVSNDVYIVQSRGDNRKNKFIKKGSVKIGMSYNVNARITQLSSEIGNKGYHVMAILKCAGSLIEKALLSEFSEYRIYGEWFNPGDRILELIERIESAYVENAPSYDINLVAC